MKHQNDNQPKESELLNRIDSLEKRVTELSDLLADHMASLPPFLLVGWIQIGAYCQRSPRTISRYAKNLAFPAYRWGRHVCTSPYAIDAWLSCLQKARAKAKDRSLNTLSDDQLRVKHRELDRALKR